MATKSFVTRMKALEDEYRERIHTTFEKLRAIEVQPYFDEKNSLVNPRKASIKKAAMKALGPFGCEDADIDFFDYGTTWKINISFRADTDGSDVKIQARKKELDALIEEGRKKFCPIEKGYHRRLHEWKERCLVDGEIYAFEAPTVEDLDKFDSVGCA